jgi:hypothetical protein
VVEAISFTNTEKTPSMATGFLPNRSAAIPQTVEVKHLPSINEAPENIHKKVQNTIYTRPSQMRNNNSAD